MIGGAHRHSPPPSAAGRSLPLAHVIRRDASSGTLRRRSANRYAINEILLRAPYRFVFIVISSDRQHRGETYRCRERREMKLTSNYKHNIMVQYSPEAVWSGHKSLSELSAGHMSVTCVAGGRPIAAMSNGSGASILHLKDPAGAPTAEMQTQSGTPRHRYKPALYIPRAPAGRHCSQQRSGPRFANNRSY